MDGWRDNIFLASKTDIRDKDGSLKEIEKSLKRLKTDYLDLWQIHHLDTIDEVNKVTSKNGALEALIEMKEQGVVKHLGITGHSAPSVLLEIMDRFDFDTVLCPVNVGDMSMKPPFITTVVKEAKEQDMGIIGMKVLAQGFVFHPKASTTTWEPITYALSQDISTIIMGVDSVEQLEENVSIARSFNPMSQKMQTELEKKTKPYRRRACFFRREYGGYDSQKDLSPPYTINNL
jgi:predicted aldo/keto reductase-like oxidoreductase